MTELETLREQLRQQQKLASLGMLSAGIAHEIQNPLNFVINFSKMSERILADMRDILADMEDVTDKAPQEVAERMEDIEENIAEMNDIADDLTTNMQKIREHGERAVSIVQGILLISRGKEGERLPTDVAQLVHEYVWLAYHAQRANDKSFNISIRENYQDAMPKMMVIPQDLSRAVLNVVNNACYAVKERSLKAKEAGDETYKPSITVTAAVEDGTLRIAVADNGTGIPEHVRQQLFHSTVTTKPIGQGTGLGMQITHDIIVNAHKGEIQLDTAEGEGTTFTFLIPVVS